MFSVCLVLLSSTRTVRYPPIFGHRHTQRIAIFEFGNYFLYRNFFPWIFSAFHLYCFSTRTSSYGLSNSQMHTHTHTRTQSNCTFDVYYMSRTPPISINVCKYSSSDQLSWTRSSLCLYACMNCVVKELRSMFVVAYSPLRDSLVTHDWGLWCVCVIFECNDWLQLGLFYLLAFLGMNHRQIGSS